MDAHFYQTKDLDRPCTAQATVATYQAQGHDANQASTPEGEGASKRRLKRSTRDMNVQQPGARGTIAKRSGAQNLILRGPADGPKLPTLIVILMLAVVYWLPVRRWFARWGTTPEELTRVMPGDAAIVKPTQTATQAVTVNAPPEDIWPWLVQMGYQRGGLYSYDGLDRLFGFLDRPSAKRILPEFQHLAVGDKIRLGPREELTVSALEPSRALVLSTKAHGMEWVWQFGLYPLDNKRTRLVSRGTERVPHTASAWFGMRVMEPAAFVMTRRMLLGLKKRSETLQASI